MELPEHVLNHACGCDARPVTPPEAVARVDVGHLVKNTPYKKTHTDISSPGPRDPARADTEVFKSLVERASGSHDGPFATMMGAMFQAFAQTMAVPGGQDGKEPYRRFASRGNCGNIDPVRIDACVRPRYLQTTRRLVSSRSLAIQALVRDCDPQLHSPMASHEECRAEGGPLRHRRACAICEGSSATRTTRRPSCRAARGWSPPCPPARSRR